ncbi:hypothetical protein SSX86_018876 [Deinandra increscens subsp. villosa]|uniref:Uncharacterized protein n=1 Tax=Deinandra increscens subsp. villosa TaxID=3103831 RepID=A0AAP0GSI4_9ASTR
MYYLPNTMYKHLKPLEAFLTWFCALVNSSEVSGKVVLVLGAISHLIKWQFSKERREHELDGKEEARLKDLLEALKSTEENSVISNGYRTNGLVINQRLLMQHEYLSEGEEDNELIEEGVEEEGTNNGKSSGSRKRGSKKENKEVKRKTGGFTKLCRLSPQLQKLIGEPELARTEDHLSGLLSTDYSDVLI